MTKNAKRIMELIEQEDYDSIIIENEKLIYEVIHRYHIKFPGYDKDDLVQCGMIALYKAARNYKPERGEFSSYAMKAILNNYFLINRSQKLEVIPDLYLENDIINSDFDKYQYKDIITCKNDDYKSSLFTQALKNALNKLHERQRYIFIERELNGRRYVDLAKELGLNYRTISHICNDTKKQLKTLLIKEGITEDYFEED